MRTAQMKAVSTNLEHRVQFNLEAGSYIVQRMTTAGVWVDDGVLQTIPSGIRFHEIDLGWSNRAIFNPNSTSTSGSVTLRNKRDTEKKIVLFAATGRIRVEE